MQVFLTVVICSCILLLSTIFNFLGSHGLTGICLPFYTSNDHSLPLSITTVVVVTVQFFCLVTIVTLAILSLYTLKNVEKYTKTQIKNQKYKKVSKKLFLIILSNLCCWLPSSGIFLLPLFGYQVSRNLLNWAIVTVVPINSVLDPITFTILTPEMITKILNFMRLQ